MLSKPKRVRSFGDNEPVGLRIVAAMSGELQQGPAKDPVVGRSDPIPIRPGAVGTTLEKKKNKMMEEEEEEEEEEELSESYTCVTAHVGGKVVRRLVYGSGSVSESGSECSGGGSVRKYGRNPRVLIMESPSPVPMAKGEGDFFLSHCYLCRKKLQGLDIFMYRGEKAFCSVECRCEQILSDEHKEKCSSEALKNQDSSYSPYPSLLLFAAGVAAA